MAIKNKDDKRIRTLNATLHIASKSGVSKVSISEVARLSQVSRAWIYKYVGKNKNDLIRFAMIEFSHQIVPRKVPWPSEKRALKKRLNEGFDLLWNIRPELLKLYLKNFSSESELGKFIKASEKSYSKDMGKALKSAGIAQLNEELIANLLIFLRISAIHFAHERSISKQELMKAIAIISKVITDTN